MKENARPGDAPRHSQPYDESARCGARIWVSNQLEDLAKDLDGMTSFELIVKEATAGPLV